MLIGPQAQAPKLTLALKIGENSREMISRLVILSDGWLPKRLRFLLLSRRVRLGQIPR